MKRIVSEVPIDNLLQVNASQLHRIASAHRHHREGRRHDAEAICRTLLTERPDFPPALHLLALMAQQQRRFPVALGGRKRGHYWLFYEINQ